MNRSGNIKKAIFSTAFDFQSLALEIFYYQAKHNFVYRSYLSFLNIDPEQVKSIDGIPFLPVEFFKTHEVISDKATAETIFTSSGTTGNEKSRHFITDLQFYKEVFIKTFELFYGPVNEVCFIALLPSYLERTGSSLVFMADGLISAGAHAQSGFYLGNLQALNQTLEKLQRQSQKIVLLGVTYALLDFAEKFPMTLKNTIIMETGGMKGKRKEMVREEVHAILKAAFKVENIHSEYGMTELLSQAYSAGEGKFYCPPWMQVLVKNIDDPLGAFIYNKSGAIHVIDLANVESCSFIATRDIGKKNEDGSFEVLGRFDHSDLRGCNLMIE